MAGNSRVRTVSGRCAVFPLPTGSEKPLEIGNGCLSPRQIPTLLKQGDNETTTPLVLIRRLRLW